MNKLTDKYDASEYKIKPNIVYREFKHIIENAFRSPGDYNDENEIKNAGSFSYKLSDSEFEFYNDLYSVGDISLTSYEKSLIAQNYKSNVVKKFGRYEASILDFLLNDTKNIQYVIAPVGLGKTTLLKYSFLYLFPQSQDLKTKIIPFYCCLDQHKNKLSSLANKEEIAEYIFENILEPRIINRLSDSIITNEDFWNYVKNKPNFAKHRLQESLLSNALEDQKKKNRLRTRLMTTNPEFWLYALKYLKEKVGKIPVIIFDNLDPISFNVMVACSWMSVRYSEYFKIKPIIAARLIYWNRFKIDEKNMYQALSQDIYPIIITSREISIYLQNRIDLVLDKIDKSSLSFSFGGGVIINKESAVLLIKKMIKLFLSQKCQDALKALSNYDLKKIAAFFKVYLSTGLIADKYLIADLLNLSEEEAIKKEVPFWILLHSLITGNKIAYFSSYNDDDSELTPNIVINLFCNGGYSINNNLIRIHTLYYLRHHRKPTFKHLLTDYLLLFNTELANEIKASLQHCVRREIECKLIISSDVYKIEKTHLVSDEIPLVYNKNVCNFYLDTLSSYFEYLSLIKDDVIYPEPVTIKDRITAYSIEDQFENVTKFLEYIFIKEKEFLTNIETTEKVRHFNNNFCIDNELFICIKLFSKTYNFGVQKNLNLAHINKLHALLDEANEINNNLLEQINAL